MPAARLSASPATYLAVWLCGMSDSVLSNWLSALVITLTLSNYRKQTPLQSLAFPSGGTGDIQFQGHPIAGLHTGPCPGLGLSVAK